MQQTIEFTFDPTKADRQERSRLEKLRWLPPLADDLKMKMPEPIRVSYGTTRKKIKENIKSNSIGKFPKIVMKESDKLKQTLKMNPNARYLTRLHNESLKDAAQKRLDQQQRDLVAIQAYDWNLVKKVSHELPFYRYVEKLQRNGQQLILEDEKEAQETLFSITMERSGSIPHDNDEFGLNATTPESTNTLQETQQDFLETLKIYMETSPFRLKQKEILEATPFELYQDYCFGKPEPLRDENEFQRTFADLDTLGHTLANCSKVVNAETEKHTIPPTIQAVIEALKLESKAINNQANAVEQAKNLLQVHNPIEKTIDEFDLLRSTLQKELVRFLQVRRQEKLQSAYQVQTLAEVKGIAISHLKEYIKASKGIKPKIPPIQNLWMERLKNSQIPDEFKSIGLAPLPKTPAKDGNEKGFAGAKGELLSFKSIVQRFEGHFRAEELSAIRQMFAQDFGDALPLEVGTSALGTRRNAGPKE